MPLRRSFGVMSEAEGNSADTTDQAQAAIDAARRARQDRIPSFRRLLEALALAVGSHASLAGRMMLPASRLSEFLNDHRGSTSCERGSRLMAVMARRLLQCGRRATTFAMLWR